MKQPTAASGKKKSEAVISDMIFGKSVAGDLVPMKNIQMDSGKVVVEGEVFAVNHKELTKSNAWVISFDVTDYTGSVRVNQYMENAKAKPILDGISKGMWVRVAGKISFSRFENDIVLQPYAIKAGKKPAQQLAKLESDINIKKAIEKIGGSIDVFNKILRSFYKKNNNLKDIIEAHGISDTRWFKQRIHTLKASSYNVGAYAFSQEAARIEAAINADNKTYMNNNYEKLLAHLEELMNSIGEYIDYVDEADGIKQNEAASIDAIKPIDNVPEEIEDNEGIDINLLKKLDELVKDNISDSAKTVIDEINRKTYIGEDGDFISVLNESVAENDYEKVHELITTYIDLNS